jgi:hypothetical protein
VRGVHTYRQDRKNAFPQIVFQAFAQFHLLSGVPHSIQQKVLRSDYGGTKREFPVAIRGRNGERITFPPINGTFRAI